MAETRLSVYIYCTPTVSNSSVFKSRLKVLRKSADLQLYDSEFQTEAALTTNAFADNASVIHVIYSMQSWLHQVVQYTMIFPLYL